MKAVIFTRPHLMYQRGETAGFADDHAQTLIEAGVARDPNAPVPASATEVPPDADTAAPQGKDGVEGADTNTEPATAAPSEPGAPPAQGKRK
ncbi:MAG: hypothetical protein ACX93U_24165 [Salipiger thiooxidans]|uniref:hypothetical protein n=1 Tax=Salipiger thiooxidans TaxID=282683 RepID=UPI001CF97695|nr:hypothetical protein [Salipiger thiooxidans]